jgi:hypothetical protein
MHGIGLWTFLTIICILGFIRKIYRLRVLERCHQADGTARNQELLARLEKLERRMANLETIVIKTEQEREFDRQI